MRMWKYIVVYWVTYQVSDLLLRQQYDSRCNCWVEQSPQWQWRSDSAKIEFKKRKDAVVFMKNNCADFSGCLLDSVRRH